MKKHTLHRVIALALIFSLATSPGLAIEPTQPNIPGTTPSAKEAFRRLCRLATDELRLLRQRLKYAPKGFWDEIFNKWKTTVLDKMIQIPANKTAVDIFKTYFPRTWEALLTRIGPVAARILGPAAWVYLFVDFAEKGNAFYEDAMMEDLVAIYGNTTDAQIAFDHMAVEMKALARAANPYTATFLRLLDAAAGCPHAWLNPGDLPEPPPPPDSPNRPLPPPPRPTPLGPGNRPFPQREGCKEYIYIHLMPKPCRMKDPKTGEYFDTWCNEIVVTCVEWH